MPVNTRYINTTTGTACVPQAYRGWAVSYRRQLRTLSLFLRDVFWAPVNSLVCELCTGAQGWNGQVEMDALNCCNCRAKLTPSPYETSFGQSWTVQPKWFVLQCLKAYKRRSVCLTLSLHHFILGQIVTYLLGLDSLHVVFLSQTINPGSSAPWS